MNTQIKRKRASNWTREMKELLVSCVRPFGNIIDSKLNSLPMIKEKSEAWGKIKETFQANGHQCSIKQLRDQWNRQKQLSRNKISLFKRSQGQTGGGSPPKEPSEMDYEIEEIAKEDFLQDFSAYDCDADYGYAQEEIENESPNKVKPLDGLVFEKLDLETPTNTDKNKMDKVTAPKKPVANRKRAFPTIASSEELLQKRILQIEDETKYNKTILQLKKKKERLKIQVQKRKLSLLNMQIRNLKESY
ncbi:uncharacterized protein LOC129941484 [Eupeodes corollae]|uniref:uncharacterized protein LOC129941484 n=1 Tax=Eupeodes corollae TaxID=290404 RepID=UPI00248F77F6|nr:uncharacterized protein LOC129941484 [Eupeodes corollae]